ncbi:MAG: DUF1667 domain-containing protein [Fidelibacterota bacterium]
MQSKELICTACPIGCRLTVYRDEKSENGFRVEGNSCKRGISYAIAEMTDPRRILTSTVKVINSHYKRLPVRTREAIPKHLIFPCMNEINRIEVATPVKMGDILMENIAGSGIPLIASRNLE